MNPGQEMPDDNIEYTMQENDVSPLHTKYVSRARRETHPRKTISRHRRCLLNDEMLRPAGLQVRRLNYGRGGRILMLPRANKTRRTNGGEMPGGSFALLSSEEARAVRILSICAEASDEIIFTAF